MERLSDISSNLLQIVWSSHSCNMAVIAPAVLSESGRRWQDKERPSEPCSVPFYQENNIFQTLAPKQPPALVSWPELGDAPVFRIGRLGSEEQNCQDWLRPIVAHPLGLGPRLLGSGFF